MTSKGEHFCGNLIMYWVHQAINVKCQ